MNWRVGTERLWIAASIFWIAGWVTFFFRLAAFEPLLPLEYLTIFLIVLGPPGGLGLIGWVVRGFRQGHDLREQEGPRRWVTRVGVAEDDFRSLRIISPILNFFLVMALVGRPFLEHFKKHEWKSDAVPEWLLVPVGFFFLVCLYIGVGTTAYYFYRAMRNVNFFAQARLLAPWSAWLMVVPLANIIAVPYVWGRAYYCSLALHPTHHASKQAAALMAVGAFALIMIGLATGIMSDDPATWPPGYDGLSLSIIAICTSTAGASLSTRIVQRISAVQQLFAERLGLVPSRRSSEDDSISAGVIDVFKVAALGLCLGLALFTAAWPSVASSVARKLIALLVGQVAQIGPIDHSAHLAPSG